jgi:hypothetical protein
MVQPSRLQHGLAPLGKGIDMKRTNLIWLGGPAAMVGGVAHTAPGLLGTVFGGYVLRLAGVRRYGAIAALHALQRERYGLPGALPSLTVFIGVGLILGSNLGLTEGLPWPLPANLYGRCTCSSLGYGGLRARNHSCTGVAVVVRDSAHGRRFRICGADASAVLDRILYGASSGSSLGGGGVRPLASESTSA